MNYLINCTTALLNNCSKIISYDKDFDKLELKRVEALMHLLLRLLSLQKVPFLLPVLLIVLLVFLTFYLGCNLEFIKSHSWQITSVKFYPLNPTTNIA